MNKFISFYNEIKPMIKEALINFNNEILKEDNKTIKDNLEVFANLNDSGKMIRGTLITLGYSFNNKNIEYAIPLSCAYEIFETAILVHDDIIDNDILRRDKETVNAYNKNKYKDLNNNNHLANSVALCIGDYGLYEANDLIIDAYKNDINLAKILKKYNDIVINTIRGEIIDVVTPFEEINNIFNDNLENTIMDIYKLKTSIYTLVGPLTLGMILGNNSDKEIDDIKRFSLPLGIAFQIQDDILGIYSDEMGKVIGSDIKEFKQTLLYAYTKNTKYYPLLLKHYGKDDYDINKVREIFTNSGAKEYCLNKMNDLYLESRKILDSIDWLDNDKKEILNDLIDFLNNRKK